MKDLFIGLIEGDGDSDVWFKDFTVSHGKETDVVSFKIDTGAQANVLSLATAHKLKAEIQPTGTGLRSYTGHRIENIGKTKLSLSVEGTIRGEVWFELVNGDHQPILGLSASKKLGLVKRIDDLTVTNILNKFPDCFEGIGCLSREHKIVIDKNVQPVINGARGVPLSMTDKVKVELQKMEEDGIISKVDKPTEWVNSMVVVEKKTGGVRICLDPRELNKAILREHHHIPTLEDIAHRFSGMKFFSNMDMKHGY